MLKPEHQVTDDNVRPMIKIQGGKNGERKFPLPVLSLSAWRFVLGALAFWGLFVTLKAWELNEKNAQGQAKIKTLRGELWQHEQGDGLEKAYGPEEGPSVAGSPEVGPEVQ